MVPLMLRMQRLDWWHNMEDTERRRGGWTAEHNASWTIFSSRAISKGRLDITKYEWRYLLECGSVSMNTGLPFGRDGKHIDRVFNNDPYNLTNCIVMEDSLNYAKSYMQAFQTSDGFQGSKGRCAIATLRDELDRQERLSRPLWP